MIKKLIEIILIIGIAFFLSGCTGQVKKPYSDPNKPVQDMNQVETDNAAHYQAHEEKIKAEYEADKENTRNRSWCFFAIVLGIAAMVIGWKFPLVATGGLGAIIAGGCGYGITFASALYPKYLAYAGLALAIGAFILAFVRIWFLIIPQLIRTTDVAKNALTPECKSRVFGKNDVDGLINPIQSSVTKSVVAKFRNSLGLD